MPPVNYSCSEAEVSSISGREYAFCLPFFGTLISTETSLPAATSSLARAEAFCTLEISSIAPAMSEAVLSELFSLNSSIIASIITAFSCCFFVCLDERLLFLLSSISMQCLAWEVIASLMSAAMMFSKNSLFVIVFSFLAFSALVSVTTLFIYQRFVSLLITYLLYTINICLSILILRRQSSNKKSRAPLCSYNDNQ